MKCSKCGGEMVKWKYMEYEELEAYLLGERRALNDGQTYEEWLRTLRENDIVLTLLRREDYKGVKEKYYVRVVERTTRNGVKLRHLTKIFRYGVGETVYGKEKENFPTAVYKIVPMDEQSDQIIRDYCKNKEEFDIDKLNKMITRALQGESNGKQK